MKCVECQKSVDTKNDRLPMGWKRRPKDDAPTCKDCWNARYVLRAITFPVSGPVDAEWKELRETLKEVWATSTEAAN